MRLFLGVDLDPGPRSALAAVLADVDLPGKPSPPENWHLTLRYLGIVDEVTFDRLLAELDQAALGERFMLRTSQLGSFPRPDRATVLWLGVGTGSDDMVEVARCVDDVIDNIGLGPEDRPFVPHVTLSRVRPPADVRSLLTECDLQSIRMSIHRVTLFGSVHVPGGVRYERLEQFDLAG